MECPACHSRNPAGFRFCGYCGAARAASGDHAPADAERRHLTVMFCDLAGSTMLSGLLDPEDYAHLLERYHGAAGEVVQRMGGFIGQYHGDGMLAYFGYPKAREDSAVLGVRAALRILRAIEELNVTLANEGHAALQMRIGLHTGLVLISEIGLESVALGKAPNLAARLQTVAEPGKVVISGDTWRLVRAEVGCRSLGEMTFKGIAEPVPVYEVAEEIEGAEAAAITPFIGRESELARLVHAWKRTAEGASQTFVVRGEPGIGKSRLLGEFRRTLDGGTVHWLALSGAESAQSSAFHPLLTLLQTRIGWERGDPVEERFEKIERFVEEFALPREETIDLLATLLGLEKSKEHDFVPLSLAAARQRLIAWLPQFLAAHAAQRAVVLAIEDLHWLDPSTLEALVFLFKQGLPPRVMLLGTARLEFKAAWLEGTNVTLDRFGDADAAGFIESVAGSRALPPELIRQVVRKADGVPLFVEEMTRMVLDTHLDTRKPGDAAVPQLAIPDTLRALLMARIDRTSKHREVAQLAAVIGGEFPYEMLRALCPLDETLLREELHRLADAGLLTRRGTIPEATFQFRHALIQAEAYQSVLRRSRRRYHEQIAQLLEERFSDTREQQPELVAHHYTEAGRAAEAVGLWVEAAQRSQERSANVEALAQVEHGLALLPALPEEKIRHKSELALMTLRGRASVMLHGYASAEVEKAYSRARKLCLAGGEPHEVYQVLGVLHAFHVARAEFPLAAAMAEEMMRLGKSTGWIPFLDNAWLSRGTNAFYLGEFAEALRCFRRALSIHASQRKVEPPRTLDIKVAALAWGGLALVLQGRPDEGLTWVHEARDYANRRKHLHSIVFAQHFLHLAHYWRDEADAVIKESEGYGALCREQGFTYWLALGAMVEGWAHVRLGRAAGFEMVEKGLAGWLRTGAGLAATQHFGFMAEVALALQRPSQGLSAISQVEKIPSTTGERCYAPYVIDLKGLLLLCASPDDHASAETAFSEALAAASAMGARWIELRAAVHLAQLREKEDRREEIGALLLPRLRKIVGGKDTTLIREATRLLQSGLRIGSSPKRSKSANGRIRAATRGTRRSGRQNRT